MSNHPIDYYDFNLKFFYTELKESAPESAAAAAPFIRIFFQRIILSLTATEETERQQHYKIALDAFLNFKRILVKVYPDYVDASDQDHLTLYYDLPEMDWSADNISRVIGIPWLQPWGAVKKLLVSF